MQLVQTLAAFIVALGVLVTFHEFGHYWVARRLGVKILRFSVGFGRPLWSFRAGRDHTEFVVAAVPLGGYVKMLDEHEGEVAAHENHRAFNRQPVLVRSAIVAAGPLANFLLALVVYWLSYMAGVEGPKPLIGGIAPSGLAERAGLRVGDEIVTVNGERTAIWDNVLNHAVDAILDGRTLVFGVVGEGAATREILLDFTGFSIDDVSRGDFFDKAGFEPRRAQIPPVIGKLVAGEAAAAAGFAPGDRILAVDGTVINDWLAWVTLVRERAGQRLEVTVERDGSRLDLTVTPRSLVEDGRRIGRIGAEVAPPPASSLPPVAVERYAPVAAAERAFVRTREVTLTTLKFMRQMVLGEASVENLSGPISIAQFAGASAKLGVSRFLEFLGLVSVSLAVLNLLPIPLLDGGHLIFYLIESVTRRPVPETVQVYGQQAGMFLLLCLMGLAIYNDLMRIF
ncbi:MAG: RIP metalloprotease RseP [Gammaproteobacteria bacterium]